MIARRRHDDDVLPDVGDIFEDEDGLRIIVREVTLTRRADGVTAFAILRLTGGTTKKVNPAEWSRMKRRYTFIRTAD